MNKRNMSEYYLSNRNEFMGEAGHEKLLIGLKKYIKTLSIEENETNNVILGVDVGACVGKYIHNVADICKEKTSQIIAIEPNPLNIEFFKKNLLLLSSSNNKNIKLFECCVSNENTVSSFYNWKNTKDNKVGNEIAGLRSGGEKICDVEVKTLEKLLDEQYNSDKNVIIKFIKIDTEGNDSNVIKGMGKYLNNTRYIIFECSDCLDDIRGPGILNPMQNVVEFLSKHGFDTYRIGTKKLFKVNDECWNDTYDKVKFWSNCFALKWFKKKVVYYLLFTEMIMI